MTTIAIELTNQPQQVATGYAYLQSVGGDFNFTFGTDAPTNLDVCHTDNRVFTDGQLGSVWAWKSLNSKVRLIVSTEG